MQLMTSFYIVVVLMLILEGIDFYTTYKVLSSESGDELNSLVKEFIGKMGLVPTLILWKVILPVAIATLCYRYLSLYSVVVMGIVDIFYIYVAYNNITQLEKTKQ